MVRMWLEHPVPLQIMQDPSNSVLLGAGTRKQGLYYFTKITDVKGVEDVAYGCNAAANVVEDVVTDMHTSVLPNKTATSLFQSKVDNRNKLDLLHARLGHPSLSKMKFVNAAYCKGVTEYNCAVCCSSKQISFQH
ncbi:uncharacterized protein [Spinacia oleracea]|uniref:GAG-pre-integrase domain-containing protein n=1 Tax=Spinacia oleracea TaxID=3562 RepID=A0ABM3RRV7_SPIOL|nr:uncharacterized protein LOC130471991 [Spinacia oleracea]